MPKYRHHRLSRGVGEVHRSQYTDLLLGAHVQISMDGRGRALDNIFTERLWRTVKYEEVYLKDYVNLAEARREIGEYIERYNGFRPHQTLGGRTPDTVYAESRCGNVA